MLISEQIKRISQLMEVKSISRPDIKGEMDEIQRVAQYLNREEGFHIDVDELIDVFDKSKEVTLTNDIWGKLENTESNAIKKGDMDKTQAAALLAGVTMRMSAYMVVYSTLTSLLDDELFDAYFFRGKCAYLIGDTSQAFLDF